MRKILTVLFCMMGTVAHAEKYCSHPPTGLFGAEGDTKSITWEMTAVAMRTDQGVPSCSKEFIFAHGLNQPIEIITKPKHLSARIENGNMLVVVPDQLRNDTMIIKLLYNTRKGRIRTGYVNYIIKVKDRVL